MGRTAGIWAPSRGAKGEAQTVLVGGGRENMKWTSPKATNPEEGNTFLKKKRTRR